MAGVLILGRGGDVGPDSRNFGEQIIPLLFGEVGTHLESSVLWSLFGMTLAMAASTL